MTAPTNYLANYGKQLIDNGHRIVPLRPHSKKVTLDKWPDIIATNQDVKQWIHQGHQGIGVICTQTPVIDIDVLDDKIANQVRDYVAKLTGAKLFRIGKSPKMIIPFKADKPFKSFSSKRFNDQNNQKHQIEILGERKQFVAYGIHPETKKPYQWVNNQSLLTIPAQDLPRLTPVLAQAVIEYFESIVSSAWKMTTQCKSKFMLASIKPTVDKTTEELQQALAYIDAEDYELWIKVGMGLHHQYAGDADGLTLWDTWSATASNYDSGIMQEKWTSFRSDNTGNPITSATILALANQAKAAILQDKIKAFYQRYVLAGGAHVIDLKKSRHKEPMSLKDFKSHHADFFRLEETAKGLKRLQIAEEWHKNPDKKKVDGIDYRPEKKRFFTDVDGSQYYNSFYFPTRKKPNHKKDLGVFYRHINYLFPKREEAKWFLDWMAFNVQYPALRSPIAPLHISTNQGTGRGWLVKVLFELIGEHNVSKTDIDAFAESGSKSQFNGYLHRSLLCVIEEIKQSSKRHFALADRIKSVITDEYQSFNLKGKPEFTSKCYANLFFMSNHLDAIVLRSEDRRLNIFHCNSAPKAPEYYTALYAWLENTENISALFHTLKTQELDIKAFKNQRVMDNEARKITIDATKNELEFAFEEFITNPPAPWMTQAQIQDALTTDTDNDPFSGSIVHFECKQLIKIIQNTHTITTQRRIKINNKMQRLWCLDNKYLRLNNSKIREIYQNVEEKSYLKNPNVSLFPKVIDEEETEKGDATKNEASPQSSLEK